MNIRYLFLLNFFLLTHISAQTFPDYISSEMQEQFLSLTQAEKEKIAAQYGIDLDDINKEKSSDLSRQSNMDDRFLDDQPNLLDEQQMKAPNSSSLFYQDYRTNPLTIKNSSAVEPECFDRNGNPIIEESYSKKKFEPVDQNECYNSFGNLIYEENLELEKEELTRFGLSIFNLKISTFSPFENIPIPDDYTLGAGDEITIKLVGSENSKLNLTVERNGTVFIPKIGEITLSGIAFKEAANLIQSRIEQELIGVNAFITMGRIKSINIFIAGEVNSPGMYSISALSTITQSLYQAGGITDIGSLRNIKVLRNGEEISVFDVYDLLIYGNSKNDIRLRSGDVLLVPPHEGLIEAWGSFKRSHIFEVKAGDTFYDLLQWTGGFDADAYPAAASLKRSSSIGAIQTITNINLLLSENLSKGLLANDSIIIPEMSENQREYVEVAGAFSRPGKFGWFEGMKISDTLSNNGDYLIDFSNETDFEIALIERFDQQKKVYSVLDFSPSEIINDPKSKSNILLHEFDVIYFLPNNLFDRFLLLDPFVKRLLANNVNGQNLKLFSVTGDVKFPGTYPLPLNASLIDALKVAGGTSDTAFLDSIEVSRVSSQNGQTESNVYEVSALSSSLEALNFKIFPRDRINIRTNEELTLEKTISIEGFVNFPGSYPLNTGETLSTAIKRAGGFKDNAFAAAALLIRKTLIDAQTLQNKKLADSIRSSYASSLLTSENIDRSIEDIEGVASIIENTKGEGRIVINLEKAINGNKLFDINLEDGDILIIPQFTNIINIIGEVRKPNVVNFSESLDVDAYLNLAGGLTQRANSDDIYIIRANGSIVSLTKSFFSLGLSKPRFQPGDTLVVPIKQNYQNPLPLWSQVTQIIYQSMVSLAAVKGL